MSKYGYIYIRYHESYIGYNVYKLGQTKDIISRMSTYITGEYIKGNLLLVIELLSNDSVFIEKIIKNSFRHYNRKDSGGTEFYDTKILNEIIPFLNKLSIKFNVIDIKLLNRMVTIRYICENNKILNLFKKHINKFMNLYIIIQLKDTF